MAPGSRGSSVGFKLLASLVFLIVSGNASTAQQPSDVDAVEKALALNSLGRYMSPEGRCQPVQRQGWENYPTVQCEYDAHSAKATLPVILLNPDSRQLARWLVTACTDTKVRSVRHCAERLALVTVCQSGAQFPVAGYVDEDVIYTFRDGVTTRMEGLDSTVVKGSDVPQTKKAVFENAPAKAKARARISSTTRQEFANFVKEPVGNFTGLKWLGTVRSEYQAAWGKERNRLMSARVAASRARYDATGWGKDFNRFCVEVAGCPTKKKQPKVCAKKWTSWPL